MQPEPAGKPNNAPFFIIGAQRSGTTLLRSMLAAHPRLAIPPESHFVPELLCLEHRYGALSRSRERVIEWLLAQKRLADFELGADYLRGALAFLEPFDTRIITATLFGEYARRQGKPRWGDKTPRYRDSIPELYSLFPNGLFIHLLRDGRDAALSASRADFNKGARWIDVCYVWRHSVRAAWAGSRMLPRSQFLEIHYEDLLRAPRETLTRVCEFLGEDFCPEMLQFFRVASTLIPAWERPWHAQLEQPLNPNNMEKWRTELTPKDLFVFQRVAERELRLADYPVVPVSAGLSLYAGAVFQQAWHHGKGLALRLASLGRPIPQL